MSSHSRVAEKCPIWIHLVTHIFLCILRTAWENAQMLDSIKLHNPSNCVTTIDRDAQQQVTGMLKHRARRWHSFLKHSPQKLGIFTPLKVLLLPLHSGLTKYFRGTQPLKTNFHNKRVCFVCNIAHVKNDLAAVKLLQNITLSHLR